MITAKTLKPLTPQSAGTYVSVEPNNAAKNQLKAIAQALGFVLTADDLMELHSTVCYAKGTFATDPVADSNRVFVGRIKDLQYWGGHDGDGYLVVVLDSPSLMTRHKEWLMRGLVHSFPDYIPHVTLKTKLKLNAFLEHAMVNVADKVRGRTLIFSNETIEGIKSDTEKTLEKTIKENNAMEASKILSPKESKLWDDLPSIKVKSTVSIKGDGEPYFAMPKEMLAIQSALLNNNLKLEHEKAPAAEVLSSALPTLGTIKLGAGVRVELGRVKNNRVRIALKSNAKAVTDASMADVRYAASHVAKAVNGAVVKIGKGYTVVAMALPGTKVECECVACGNVFEAPKVNANVCGTCIEE